MSPATEARVIVVGAGIAGLTAAIALNRVGISVEVYERATALTQAGTALSLWPNALAALDRIGLADEIARIGIPEPSGTVQKPSGRLIMKLDQSRLHEHLGSTTLVVQRGDLQDALLGAAADVPIQIKTSVKRIGTQADTGFIELTDGTVHRASVVLACDGIHSISRSIADNPPPTFRGHTSWRAVLKDASHLVPEACLTVGRGKQFIASPLSGDATYWAADVGLPEGENERMADRKGFLLRTFAGWHDPISELIERTDETQLVIADIYDSIPKSLKVGHVGLLGDAAHPMTPDLGQGACQGIEDAVVMAACIEQGESPGGSLTTYESLRLARVQRIVRDSRRIGRIATAESAVGASVRDSGVRWMPDWINSRLVARYASEASFLRTLPADATFTP